MSLTDDKRSAVALMRSDPTLRISDPRLVDLLRRMEPRYAGEIDARLAELDAIAPPGPGFDRRKEQRRYDRLLEEIASLREEHALTIASLHLAADHDLTESADRAQRAAAAFDRQLEEIFQ